MTDRINGHTLLIGLMADPIRHSLSPTMHNESIVKLGLNYAYLAFEVDNVALPDAVRGIRALKMRGSNISMPNKQKIIPLLDELSPEAELIGSVNTVVNRDDSGYLVGYNTDGTGAITAIEHEGTQIKDQVITLCGSGGTGTAIGIVAAMRGAKEIHVYNKKDRHYPTGEALVEKINANTACVATMHDVDDTEDFKNSLLKSGLFIDSTGVGMKPLEDLSTINDPEMIHSDLVVFDTVYVPRETKLLKFAREHGAKKVINGIEMMLYQGAEAFKLFTGEDMPIDYIRDLMFGED